MEVAHSAEADHLTLLSSKIHFQVVGQDWSLSTKAKSALSISRTLTIQRGEVAEGPSVICNSSDKFDLM